MEQLLYSIALRYGKGKITEAGLNYASKLLGIEPSQDENVEYTYGMPFQGGNPMNMLKRGALNTGFKFLTSGAGGSILPFAGIGGLAMLANKFRKPLTGYDTQQAYEDARTERRANKRLDRITNRMLDGKNYGNYEEALLDSGAGAVDIDGNIMYGTDYFPDPPKEKKYREQPNPHQDNNAGSNRPSAPQKATEAAASSNQDSYEDAAYGFRKGGIANL